MRIISGTARGTKLYTLEGTSTRPTLDRVKEAVFNIINEEISNSIVLDLFSGSGAIGLEFASRGAKKVLLCDNSKAACSIIKKNIEKTNLGEKVELYNCDFLELIKNLENEKIDIIYLDPPYETDFVKQALKELINNKIIHNGLIIVETDNLKRVSSEIEGLKFSIEDIRKYGRAYILFLRKINKKGD